LLNPEKKGQWWISGSESDGQEGSHSEVVDFVHKESLEAEKLLQLAASQRMNTDIRRTIFCAVMGGEDYLDAFEKILRIKLSGKQVYSSGFPF
jgi:nucleolar MIF4G domain-containing protein 1